MASGTSVIVTVPREWLNENDLGVGDEVLMIANGELRFVKMNKKNMNELRNKISGASMIPDNNQGTTTTVLTEKK